MGNPEGIYGTGTLRKKMIRKVIGVYAVAMTGSQGAMLLGYRFNVSLLALHSPPPSRSPLVYAFGHGHRHGDWWRGNIARGHEA